MARTAYDGFWWDHLSGTIPRGPEPDFGGNYRDPGLDPQPGPRVDPQAARDLNDREVIEKLFAELNARPQPAAEPDADLPSPSQPAQESKKSKAKPQGAGLAEPDVRPPAAGLSGRPVTLPSSREALSSKDTEKLLADQQIAFFGRRMKDIPESEKKKRARELFDLTLMDRMRGRGADAVKARDAMIKDLDTKGDIPARKRALDTEAATDRKPHLDKQQALSEKRRNAQDGLGPALTAQEAKDLAAAEAAITKIDSETSTKKAALDAEDTQLRLYNETQQRWADQDYELGGKIKRFGRNSAKIGGGFVLGAVGAGITSYAMDGLGEDDSPEAEAARNALFEVDQTGVMTPDQEATIRAKVPPEVVDALVQDATPAEDPGMYEGNPLAFSPGIMPPNGMTFGDPLAAGAGLLPPGVSPSDRPIPPPMGINQADRPIPPPRGINPDDVPIPPQLGFSPDDMPIPPPTMSYGPTSLMVEGDFMPPAPPAPEETLPRTLPPSLINRPDIRAELDRLAASGDREKYDALLKSVMAEDELNRLGSDVDAGWSEDVTSQYPDLNRYIDMAGTNARDADLGLPPSVDMVPDTLATRAWDGLAAAQDATVQRGYEFLSDPIYNAWDNMIAENDNPVANWVNEQDPRLRNAASGVLSAVNPFNVLDYAIAPTEERAMQPYRAARDFGTMMEALGLGPLIGAGSEGPIADQGLLPMEARPTDPADVFGDRMAAGGTGASLETKPTFGELQKLEEIGALGDMTAAEYAMKYGVSSQANNPLPSIGPMPESSVLGDSRRDPRPQRPKPPIVGVRPEFPGGMPFAPPQPGGARPEFAPGGMPAAPPSFFGDTKPEFPGAMPAAPIEQRTLDNLPMDYPLTYDDLVAMASNGGLGVNPDGSPITAPQAATQGLLQGRNVDMGAELAPEQGGGDIFTGIGNALGFGAAYASTPDDQQARDEAITSYIENDEVLNPKGSWRAGLSDWVSGAFDMGTNVGVQPDTTIPPRPEPPVAATEPLSTAPATGAPAITGAPSAPGTVGDFNASREVARTTGPAGLAEDAADAEAELNWINRQMRDKLGLDASQRAKAAEALISGGAAMLASDGDGWQAFGEGVQAGLGSVQAADAADAEAAFAEQEAMLEESRWRAEYALDEIRARNGGGEGGDPSKIREIRALTQILMAENPGMSEAEASKMAREQAYKVDPIMAQILANMAGAN